MKPGRRRLLRRLLLALGLAGAGTALLLAFAPLPVGWLVNALAPDTPDTRVRVAAATLRLRPFGAGPVLDVRGLAVDQDGRPLARLARLDVLAHKRALFAGRASLVVGGEDLELILPPADDDTAPPTAATPPPDVPALLAALRPRLADDPRALVVSLRSVRIRSSDTSAGAPPALPALERVDLTLGPRPDGELAARLEVLPAGPRAPLLGLDLVVSADHRRATLDLALPPAEIADLAILASPGLVLPAAGRFSARARAELDLAALLPVAASLELEGDELRAATPSVLAPPPARLRLRFRATEDFHGLVAEHFSVSAPGLDLTLRRLEISVAPALDALRVAWELKLDADPATAWTDEWRRRLAALPPPLAALGAEVRHIQVTGDGSGSLRLHDDIWRLESVDFTQRHEARVGPTTLRAELVARQASPEDPVEFSLKLPEINPAANRPATDASPLAAFDFPLSLSLDAHLTPEARLARARVRLAAGPGRLRPVGPLVHAIPFTALELDAFSPDGRGVTLEKMRLAHGDTVLSAAGSTATLRADDLVDLDLTLSAAAPRLADWTGLLPPTLAEVLLPLGWTTADVGLGQFAATVQATLSPSAPEQARFVAAGSASARIGEAAVPIEFRAGREAADAAIRFSARLPRFNPAEWPGRPDPVLAWADLNLPASLELDGHLAPADLAPHARLRFATGPGAVLVPASVLGVAVPVSVHSLAVEAALAGDPARIDVPSLRLTLDHGLVFSASEARLDLRTHPIIDARWSLAPFVLADALALWPEAVEPELRAQTREHLRGGRLERLDGRVGLDLPPDAPALIRVAEADLVVAGLAAAGSLLPGPVALDRLTAELRWPRLLAGVDKLRVTGAELADVKLGVADLAATTLAVTTEADFRADLAALPEVAQVPPGYTGRLSGRFAAEAQVRPDADLPDSVNFGARVAAADFHAPELATGNLDARVEGSFDARRRATLAVELDASRLTWAPPELRAVRLHPELRATFASELGADFWPAQADLTLATPDLLGRPLALTLTTTWPADAASPQRIDLTELGWGRTRMAGDYQTTPEGPRVKVRASLIDVPQLWAALQARLAAMPAAPAIVTESESAPETASPVANLAATVLVERVELGEGRFLSGLDLGFACDADGEPRTASFTANESEGNRFTATLRPAPSGTDRLVEVHADDVPRWAGALAAPFRARPAPADYAPMVANLETVAGLLAGGSLRAEATLPADQNTPRVDASLVVRDATLVRFPRVIQLLALKSGKQLQQRPLVRELAIGRVSLIGQRVEIGGVALDGTGLIDNLKLATGSYVLDSEALTLDGSYFGIGFEVEGTRSRPDIYLKDNFVIRAIGTTSELDFGE